MHTPDPPMENQVSSGALGAQKLSRHGQPRKSYPANVLGSSRHYPGCCWETLETCLRKLWFCG